MRSLPNGSRRNFQSKCSRVRGWWKERAKRSRIWASSPSRNGRVTKRSSASMRRFDGADGADVDARAAAAAGHDADRSRGDRQRIGKNFEERADQRADDGMPRQAVADELVVAVLERRADADDLEAGVLEQLDQRGARIEDQMRAEVVGHVPPLGKEIQQSLRIECRQQQQAAEIGRA